MHLEAIACLLCQVAVPPKTNPPTFPCRHPVPPLLCVRWRQRWKSIHQPSPDATLCPPSPDV